MYWIGLIIGLGALLGIPLWRGWIQQRLPRATDRVIDITRTAFVFLGAAIGTMGYLQSEQQNEMLQGTLTGMRQELTESQQKLATAEQALHEVRAQQRPRTLSQEQHQSLIERLPKGPKGPIDIHSPDGDAEAQRFAKQFSKVLTDAGWTVRLQLNPTPVGGDHPIGLQFAVSRPQRGGPEAEIPPHGEFLLQILRELGLEISRGIPKGYIRTTATIRARFTHSTSHRHHGHRGVY